MEHQRLSFDKTMNLLRWIAAVSCGYCLLCLSHIQCL